MMSFGSWADWASSMRLTRAAGSATVVRFGEFLDQIHGFVH